MAVNNVVRTTGALAVTPSDSANLSKNAEKLWIGTAGLGGLKVTMRDGSVITFAGVPAGLFEAGIIKRVWSTGTTVSDIIALY